MCDVAFSSWLGLPPLALDEAKNPHHMNSHSSNFPLHYKITPTHPLPQHTSLFHPLRGAPRSLAI